MRGDAPKLLKDAQRVRVMLAEAVSAMPRKHKYSRGVPLEEAAEAIVLAFNDTWREPDLAKKPALAAELIRLCDKLRFRLQLAQEMGAFRSFALFTRILEEVDSIGA